MGQFYFNFIILHSFPSRNSVKQGLYSSCIMRHFLAFLFLFISAFLQAQSGFVENKGQWPKEVLFAVDIHEGKLFIQNNGYRVHQWDLSGMHHADSNWKLDSILNVTSGFGDSPKDKSADSRETLALTLLN